MMLSPESETRGAYGLGYKMPPVAEGVRMVGHDGANPGWRSGFITLPATGVGIVVLTNSGVGGRIVADIV